MPSSGKSCCVPPVRTQVSEESIAPNIRVERIGEVGTMLAVTSNQSKLQKNNQKRRFFTKGKLRNFLEGDILHSYRRETSKFT
jgi:hypothetical protein